MKRETIKIHHHNRTIDGTLYIPDYKNTYPVIIFSHGYNGHQSDFARTAEYFAENGIGALCYTFCGGSIRDNSELKTTEMTLFTEKEDLCAVLDYVLNLEAPEIYLFGASQGGMVSALTAEERKMDVKGLILLYPALCIVHDWNQKYPVGSDIPEKFDFWGMMLGKEFVTSIQGLDIYKEIGKYDGPVLIMHGQEDDIVDISYGKWAASHYVDARLEVFSGEGHGFSEAGNRRMEAMAMYFIHNIL